MSNTNTKGLAKLQQGKILVAGHRGMVGSALVRRLQEVGCENLIVKSRAEVNLEDQQ